MPHHTTRFAGRAAVLAAGLAIAGLPPAPVHAQNGRLTLERIVPPVPTPASFVSDLPGLVPADTQAIIDARIRRLQQEGRGDIGVAILPSIGDYEPYEVGVAIYREWKIGRIDSIGSERRNLGALLLVVPKELAPDRRGHCWITTGTGSEGLVTDAAAGAICRDAVVPRLRERDYGGAVLAGVEAIAAEMHEVAAGGEGGSPDGSGPGAGRVFAWIGGVLASLAGLVAGVVGVRRHRRNRPRICPRCGKPMRRLEEAEDDGYLPRAPLAEERVGSVDYDVWFCADCRELRRERYPKWFTSYRKCPECGARTARTKRRVITAATTASTGLAEDTTTCTACGMHRVERVTLPRHTASSGSGGGRGGSSGGSSFGGSGSTSGGGGGSSY